MVIISHYKQTLRLKKKNLPRYVKFMPILVVVLLTLSDNGQQIPFSLKLMDVVPYFVFYCVRDGIDIY